MISSTGCRGVILAGIVLGASLGAYAQAAGPGGPGSAQTLSNHAPNAAEIIASHDENAARYFAERAARLKRRRIDLYSHLKRDSETLQGMVAKLNSDLKSPAGTDRTPRQTQLALKDAREIQKISGEIYKRMVQ